MKLCFEYLSTAGRYLFHLYCVFCPDEPREDWCFIRTRDGVHWVVWPSESFKSKLQKNKKNGAPAPREKLRRGTLPSLSLQILKCKYAMTHFYLCTLIQASKLCLEQERFRTRRPKLRFPWWKGPLLFVFLAPCSSLQLPFTATLCSSTQPG